MAIQSPNSKDRPGSTMHEGCEALTARLQTNRSLKLSFTRYIVDCGAVSTLVSTINPLCSPATVVKGRNTASRKEAELFFFFQLILPALNISPTDARKSLNTRKFISSAEALDLAICNAANNAFI
eukprot:scaffold647850_cov46-Prasinocladus_malaysianus.AAC.2